MITADEIRSLGSELYEAAEQLEFERAIVGEAIELLKATLGGQYDRATVRDFLRRYENRKLIYASQKLARVRQ